ncbi:MAG: tetratricopeptide repeat protein [Lachnospiraceae bacterium]|nr:tetratricopeptide repeat protein [Lachnospiraceae bacterium]
MKPTRKKSRTKTIILAVAIVLAIVIAVTVSILVIGNSPSRRLSEQLDLGNRYLSELDYEQAVAAYEAALEIDPKSSDAHLGLIRAYIALGDEEGLQDALRRAEDALDKDAYAALQTAAEGLRGTSAEAQEPVVSWTDQSEKSAFLDRIRQEEGTASENEFQTMQGTEWLPFPGDVYGYVSSAFVDLDGDGTQEAVILRTASDGIFVDIYRGKEGGYEKSFSSKISEFDPSSAQMIYLFRNPSVGAYFIFADSLSTGTYTRVTDVSADLYTLTADALTPSLHCEWSSMVNTQDEFSRIAETLKGAGVPYAVYAADYDNRSAGDDFTILCNIQLRSEDAPSFEDLKLFLKITAN